MSWRSISLFNYPFHYKNVQTTLWGIPNIHRRHINPNIVLGYARSPFISLYHLISSLVGHVALSKLYPQELQAQYSEIIMRKHGMEYGVKPKANLSQHDSQDGTEWNIRNIIFSTSDYPRCSHFSVHFWPANSSIPAARGPG